MEWGVCVVGCMEQGVVWCRVAWFGVVFVFVVLLVQERFDFILCSCVRGRWGRYRCGVCLVGQETQDPPLTRLRGGWKGRRGSETSQRKEGRQKKGGEGGGRGGRGGGEEVREETAKRMWKGGR